MKILLLVLCLGLAGVSGARSQTSPAPVSKAPASEAATLTPEERTRAIEYLKQTEKDFLAAIDGVSEAQWKFKAAPDRWSIAETAEHIAVTEQFIWDLVSNKIMKSPAAPEKKAEVKGEGRNYPDKDSRSITQSPGAGTTQANGSLGDATSAGKRVRVDPGEGDHLRDRNQGRFAEPF